MKKTGLIVWVLLGSVLLLPPLTWGQTSFKVGFLTSLTGDTAFAGIQMRQGAEIAAEEINEAGGINGSRVQLIIENDDSQASKAASAVYKLVYQDKVMVVIGATASSPSYAAQKITEEAKVVQIAPSGSSPSLTTEGKNWFFRASLSSLYQMSDMTKYHFDKLGIKKFAVIAEQDAMAKGAEERLLAELQKLGLTPVAREKFQPTDMDFTAQLIRIKSTDPEALALFGQAPKCAQVAQQARNLGIKARFFGGTTLGTREFIELGGPAVDKMVISFAFNEDSSDPMIQDFKKKMLKKFNESMVHFTAPQAYDTLYMLKTHLKDYKLSTNYNDAKSLTEDRRKIWEAMTKVKNYKGVGATYSFGARPTAEDRDGIQQTLLFQVQNGKFVQIWPEVK